VRQIEQIESGEMSSFYGARIKLTAAKKVATLLGLKEEDAFDYGNDVVVNKKETLVEPETPELKTSKKNFAPVESKITAAGEANESQKQKQVVETISSSLIGAKTEKRQSKKYLFFWLSLVAVVAFSVINLRPFFWADKKEEPVVVQEEVLEKASVEANAPDPVPTPNPVPASTPQTVGDAPASAEACPVADASVPSYRPSLPKKAADLVYVQAKTKQVICVLDASGKIQNKTIEPGVGASFYGNPPFRILSSGLAQVDIFFQGVKVRPANIDGKTILLESADIVQLSTPTDSQFR